MTRRRWRLWALVWILAPILAFGASAAAQDLSDAPVVDGIEVAPANPDENPASLEAAEDTGQSARETVQTEAPFQTWELLVAGIVSGFVIPVVQQQRWGEEARKLAALVTAGIVAVGSAVLQGELDNTAFTMVEIVKLAGAAFVAYQTVWQAKYLAAVPKWIEATIFPGKPRPG